MVIILAMMQFAKRIPFENPDVLMMVRGLYVASNVIILGVYLYTQNKINTKKGTFGVASHLPSSRLDLA